jgi:hypothetical protein
MEIETFDSVFDALADTPAEAANMKARSELLSALKTRVRSLGCISGGGSDPARHHPPPAQ